MFSHNFTNIDVNLFQKTPKCKESLKNWAQKLQHHKITTDYLTRQKVTNFGISDKLLILSLGSIEKQLCFAEETEKMEETSSSLYDSDSFRSKF